MKMCEDLVLEEYIVYLCQSKRIRKMNYDPRKMSIDQRLFIMMTVLSWGVYRELGYMEDKNRFKYSNNLITKVLFY